MSQTTKRWNDFLCLAKEKCSSIAFANWLEPIRAKEEGADILELEVPNIYVREYLLNNFQEELRAHLNTGTDGTLPLSFTIVDVKKPEPKAPKVAAQKSQRLNLNRLYTFEHFIEGSENTFIKSCAEACAKSPGTLYNPLFIHAPAGLGKTHLLHSIAAEAKKLRPNAKIECISTEGFINELVDSLKNKSVDRMKRRFRSLDILLIDDIQFLQNRLNFEEELIHTFEALLVSGGQVVVSSDCPPDQLKLSERIRGRFQGGLVATIQMPGPETRAAILQHKASLRSVSIPDDVALFLSHYPMTSVRALEGLVNRICAHTQITQKPITKQLAEELTSDLLVASAPSRDPIAVGSIIKAVARHYRLEVSEIKGKKRTARLSEARAIAMHLARELVSAPLTTIAKAFNRTHSTLLWACEKVESNLALKQRATAIQLSLK